MSSVELYRQVIADLPLAASRDLLTQQIAGLLAEIDRTETEAPQDLDELYRRCGPPAELLLAVAAPLLAYGGQPGSASVAGALQAVADRIDQFGGQGPTIACEDLLGCVAWGLLTLALATDRVDAAAQLTAVCRTSPYDGGVTPLFTDSSMRHPSARGREAGSAYDARVAWLRGLPLLDALPLLARPGGIEAAFAEADFVAALLVARAGAEVYSRAAFRDGVPESRLSRRASRPEERRGLCRLFGCSDSELETALNAAQALIRSDDPFGWRRSLFPSAEE